MNVARDGRRISRVAGIRVFAALLILGVACARGGAQTDPAAGRAVGDKPDATRHEIPADQKTAGKVVGDSGPAAQDQQRDTLTTKSAGEKPAAETVPAQAPSLIQNATERRHSAWQTLEDAVSDQKHAQTRIQALAALGLLRSSESERMIGNAMLDADVDVRTAAVLAAGQTRDPNLTTSLRNLLDDKEPQVAFAAAMTLAKMGDRSGEDILMAVVDGDRKTQAGVLHGTEHKINKDLHNPAKLAKLGAMQGAAMLLGPFGFGLTAIEFMRQSGGDVARAAAIEQIAQEKTEPIHRELVDALKDKDPGVRAAAAKALVDYHDQATQDAIYTLLLDPKDPVRLTAAASYLRIVGVPGPMPSHPTPPAKRMQRRLTKRALK